MAIVSSFQLATLGYLFEQLPLADTDDDYRRLPPYIAQAGLHLATDA